MNTFINEKKRIEIQSEPLEALETFFALSNLNFNNSIPKIDYHEATLIKASNHTEHFSSHESEIVCCVEGESSSISCSAARRQAAAPAKFLERKLPWQRKIKVLPSRLAPNCHSRRVCERNLTSFHHIYK